EHLAEDRRMRLRAPEGTRAERRVHLQMVVRDERDEVATGVRDEPELQPLRAQLLQHGARVLEQLEVLGVLELGVALDPLHRPLARLAVAGRVELEAEALAQAAVALGPELRPRAGDREVDVEENGAQHHEASSSQRAVSTCVCRCSPSNAQATVWPIVQPRARSRSRPSSETSRSKRYSTSVREWPSSLERTIGATPNSRSPTSGFGSIASHGSRCAARTLSPCRSWWSSTCCPCVCGGCCSASS